MGLLDKLLGGVILPPTPKTRTSAGSTAHRPGAKGTYPTGRPVNPMRQPAVRPRPEELSPDGTGPIEAAPAPVESAAEPVIPAATEAPAAEPVAEAPAPPPAETEPVLPPPSWSADDILAELFTESGKRHPHVQPAAEPKPEPAVTEPEEEPLHGQTVGTMGAFTAEAEQSAEPEPAVPAAAAPPIAVAERETAEPEAATDIEPCWNAVTQRKLDRYFARLRQVYPDGEIVRLNTGQKKLAERGAQLRREIHMEGCLDAFFALGGFTYRRSEGGRPSVVQTAREQQGLLRNLRAAFPQGAPSVAAVQQADHRLYLNLRAAARREQCTMTEFLSRNELLHKKECVS